MRESDLRVRRADHLADAVARVHSELTARTADQPTSGLDAPREDHPRWQIARNFRCRYPSLTVPEGRAVRGESQTVPVHVPSGALDDAFASGMTDRPLPAGQISRGRQIDQAIDETPAGLGRRGRFGEPGHDAGCKLQCLLGALARIESGGARDRDVDGAAGVRALAELWNQRSRVEQRAALGVANGQHVFEQVVRIEQSVAIETEIEHAGQGKDVCIGAGSARLRQALFGRRTDERTDLNGPESYSKALWSHDSEHRELQEVVFTEAA